MSDTNLKREDEIDARANEMFANHPDLQSNGLSNAEQKLGDSYAQAGIDQAQAFANDPANASGNLDALRDKEDNPFNYSQDTEDSAPKQRRFKILAKKYGPAGGIVGLILGGMFGFSVLLTPSLAIVHLKEIFTNDLNDQVSAMDIRTNHVFRAKLKNLGKSNSLCKGIVNIRCGLRGMSDRQIANFEKAGIDVEKGKKNPITRKTSVEKLTFTSSTGEKIPVTSIKDVNKMLIDKNIRSQLRRAYNPRFYSAWDATAGKVLARFNETKASKITGDTDEERDKAIDDAVSGDEASVDADTEKKSTDGEDETQNQHNSEYNDTLDKMKDTIDGSSGFKGVFKGAAKGVGVIGSVDTACTVYNTSRLVEAGAKIIRAQKLVAFAMIFFNLADKIKAGDATPEEVTYAGNKLTAIDTETKILDESSSNGQKVNNPYYGKSALDSEGAKAAFYNEAPNLTARAQQFMAGGAMVGTLSKVNDKVSSILGGRASARSKCKVVQNGFVRAGSFIIGGIMAIGSFGTSTAVSIAGSVALSFAMPILVSYLKDMVAGTVVDASTKGADAGNAIFSGAGIMLGDMAMARGMQPANESQIAKYKLATAETNQDMIATETEDAKSKPFDIMNEYSLVGSLARKLLPTYSAGASSLALLPLNIPSILSDTIPTVKAEGDFNGERFQKCNDAGYEELGINADIFCNVRYIMTPTELAMDTDSVYEYMTTHDYVDDDSGDPKGAYADFVAECVDREGVWGEASGEESSDYGVNCIDGKSKYSQTQLDNFRVYTMDRSITDGMDNGPVTGGGTGLSGGSEFRVASFNMRGAAHTDGPKSDDHRPHKDSKERMQHTLSTITSNQFQIVGTQELEPGQAKMLHAGLPNFDHTTQGKDQDEIIWDTTKFTKVDEGTWQSTYFEGAIQEPWVKLRDNSTQQELYVMNVHDPINRGHGNAQTRYENALKHLAQAKKLSESAPVVFTGDFNEGYTKNSGSGALSDAKTTYCVLVGDGTMSDAYDLTVPRDSGCPNNPKERKAPDAAQIDHIYLSSGVQAADFKAVKVGYTSNGSDHPTVYSDVVIPGQSSSNAGTDFIASTYNIKSAKGARMDKILSNIRSNNMDIVGMQEVQNGAYQELLSKITSKGDYAAFPSTMPSYDPKKQIPATERTIIYRTDKFSFVKSDYITVPIYTHQGKGEPCTHNGGCDPSQIPVVWLKDKLTGQVIIFINTHNAAYPQNADDRSNSAAIYIEQINKLKSEGLPIFFTGDFNEGYGVRKPPKSTTLNGNYKNLFYCKLWQSGLLVSAEDTANGSKMYCNKSRGIGGVDYIYTSPNVQAKWFKSIRGGNINTSPAATDHNALYARLVVPSANGSTGTGSDIGGNDYASECGKYLHGGNYCPGQKYGNECTAFVIFRLVKHGVIQERSLGNGGDFTTSLAALGFKKDTKPAVHAVFSTSATSHPSLGHTGIVSAVNADGSITVEEYNYTNGHAYDSRKISKAEYTSKHYTFAHTEVKYK